MKKGFRVFMAAAALAAMCSVASAGMWWQRGDPGSTWQDWYFDIDVNPAAPEQFDNPYGVPSASIFVQGDAHDPAGWYEEYLGRYGVWHADFTSVTITIENAKIQNPYKEVWVEVGYRGYLVDSWLEAWVGNQPLQDILLIDEETGGVGWKTLLIGWKIWPNPDREVIYLAFEDSGADIDYIKVDTICVPEPATLVLLTLGAVLLRRKI